MTTPKRWEELHPNTRRMLAHAARWTCGLVPEIYVDIGDGAPTGRVHLAWEAHSRLSAGCFGAIFGVALARAWRLWGRA